MSMDHPPGSCARAGRQAPRARPPLRAAIAAAIVLGATAPGAASAAPPCVPGSIGPSGCASIRPEDLRSERPGVPALDPDLPLGPAADPATRRADDLRELSPADPGVLRLERTAPRDPAMGRDPRAVQSFQTPYIFD